MVQSPEYNDLQLALDQFAKSKTNVLLCDSSGQCQMDGIYGAESRKYQQVAEKIKYQLTEQGFNNIADFRKDGDKSCYAGHHPWVG